jgi:ketosteroid isomerase-like protein
MIQSLSVLGWRAALAALTVFGVLLLAPAAARAAQPAADAAAVDMVAGDQKVLEGMVEAHLTYGHSHGMLQDKAAFVKFLVGPKAEGKFNWIKLSGQTVDVVGDTALVRHVFDAENLPPDGKVTTAHILVLQVWKRETDGWKLLARQACPL